MTEPNDKDETLFCFNCDTEAVAIMDETKAPICWTCLVAYECGQGSPKQTHTMMEKT